MRRSPLLLLALALVGCTVKVNRGGGDAPRTALVADTAALRGEVLAMLAHGARAWNAGDLEAFLSDYAPDATFVGRNGLVHGIAAIREGYAARFAPGAARDSLRFEGLEVDPLAADAVHAVATYVLFRGDSVTAHGPTSLVLRRTAGRWRITHDHSS